MTAMPAKSTVRLVRLTTRSGEPVDGALWEPSGVDPVAAVVHLHGKGGNFYTGPGRFVPERSAGTPITHLSINMGCHDLAYTRYDIPSPDFSTAEVPVGGGMWERISAGHEDVAAAVDHLRTAGYGRVFVSGHSSGGYYAVDYAGRDPELAGVVLLSPLTTNRTALPRWFPGPGDLDAALERARAMVADGHGHHLIPLSSWYYAISATSLLERADDPVDRWEHTLAGLPYPALMIWGTAESRDQLWRDIAERCARPDIRTLALPGCEHHFAGFEDTVTAALTDFTLTP
ncbi:MAG TPA: alpha/beta fold hydrolase [Mycobacteriales bacterium]|nr:alpha/beta fold hydrolase [Mycobacteriales bacterium]